MIKLNEDYKQDLPQVYEFFNYKNKLIKPSFDEDIIFADSVISSGKTQSQEKIFYYQKKVKKEILKSEIEHENGEPLITIKFFL
jgi:hypothetical protein